MALFQKDDPHRRWDEKARADFERYLVECLDEHGWPVAKLINAEVVPGQAVPCTVCLLGPKAPSREFADFMAVALTVQLREVEDNKGMIIGPFIETSDEATCMNIEGEMVSAFMAGERCWRVTVSAVTDFRKGQA